MPEGKQMKREIQLGLVEFKERVSSEQSSIKQHRGGNTSAARQVAHGTVLHQSSIDARHSLPRAGCPVLGDSVRNGSAQGIPARHSVPFTANRLR